MVKVRSPHFVSLIGNSLRKSRGWLRTNWRPPSNLTYLHNIFFKFFFPHLSESLCFKCVLNKQHIASIGAKSFLFTFTQYDNPSFSTGDFSPFIFTAVPHLFGFMLTILFSAFCLPYFFSISFFNFLFLFLLS